MADGKVETIILSKTDDQSWGFRIGGGPDFGTPLTVTKVIGGTVAEKSGMKVGDILLLANGQPLTDLSHCESYKFLHEAGNFIELTLERNISVIPLTPSSAVQNKTFNEVSEETEVLTNKMETETSMLYEEIKPPPPPPKEPSLFETIFGPLEDYPKENYKSAFDELVEELLRQQELETGFSEDYIEESEFAQNVYVQESTVTGNVIPDIVAQESIEPQPVTIKISAIPDAESQEDEANKGQEATHKNQVGNQTNNAGDKGPSVQREQEGDHDEKSDIQTSENSMEIQTDITEEKIRTPASNQEKLRPKSNKEMPSPKANKEKQPPQNNKEKVVIPKNNKEKPAAENNKVNPVSKNVNNKENLAPENIKEKSESKEQSIGKVVSKSNKEKPAPENKEKSVPKNEKEKSISKNIKENKEKLVPKNEKGKTVSKTNTEKQVTVGEINNEKPATTNVKEKPVSVNKEKSVSKDNKGKQTTEYNKDKAVFKNNKEKAVAETKKQNPIGLPKSNKEKLAPANNIGKSASVQKSVSKNYIGKLAPKNEAPVPEDIEESAPEDTEELSIEEAEEETVAEEESIVEETEEYVPEDTEEEPAPEDTEEELAPEDIEQISTVNDDNFMPENEEEPIVEDDEAPAPEVNIEKSGTEDNANEKERGHVKQKPHRKPFFPITPHPRRLVLPGGEMKFQMHPQEAYNDDFIAETLSGNAEVIIGTTIGINFMKYKKNFDFLKSSNVYQMIHGSEEKCPGSFTGRPEKLMAAEDYKPEEDHGSDV